MIADTHLYEIGVQHTANGTSWTTTYVRTLGSTASEAARRGLENVRNAEPGRRGFAVSSTHRIVNL